MPLRDNLFDNYLRLPEDDPGRQAAERWRRDHGSLQPGKPTETEHTAFRAFALNRYFETVLTPLRRTLPNHLTLGCRFYGMEAGRGSLRDRRPSPRCSFG